MNKTGRTDVSINHKPFKPFTIMATYFPYSSIISLCNLCIDIVRHPYFGEWSVCQVQCTPDKPAVIEISEIYY